MGSSFWCGVDEGAAVGGQERGAGDGEGFGCGVENEGGSLGEVWGGMLARMMLWTETEFIVLTS